MDTEDIKISDEEHEVNLLMLHNFMGNTVWAGEDGLEKLQRVVMRITYNNQLAESILHKLTNDELFRVVLDCIIKCGAKNLNDAYWEVYKIHQRWWDIEMIPF